MLREVERSLSAGGAPLLSCDGPTSTPSYASGNHNTHANFPTVGRQQSDLMVFALACGLTRVSSLQWSYARSLERHEWIDTSTCSCGTLTRDHHTISHEGGNQQSDRQMAIINRWYAEQLAYTLGRMDAIDEGGSTLLDNSLMLWCSEVSYASTHSYNNIRAFLFGSAGGKINTGQHIAYNGVAHNGLHVTLLNAFGNPAQTFGDDGYGTGPLPGILK